MFLTLFGICFELFDSVMVSSFVSFFPLDHLLDICRKLLIFLLDLPVDLLLEIYDISKVGRSQEANMLSELHS